MLGYAVRSELSTILCFRHVFVQALSIMTFCTLVCLCVWCNIHTSSQTVGHNASVLCR